MKSQQWVMNLFFIIGVPLFVIGLTLFGTGLFMRRRILHKKNLASRIYSDIDIENDLTVKSTYASPNIDRPKRINIMKVKLYESRIKLQDLKQDQKKFSKLIVKNDIQTHKVVDNKIVYEPFMISNYPKLYKHLLKLHKIQHTVRYYRNELIVLSKSNIADLINHQVGYIKSIQQQLVINTKQMKLNIYNRKEYLKDDPEYDMGLPKGDKVDDYHNWPIRRKPAIDTYLSLKKEELIENRLDTQQELRQELKNYKAMMSEQLLKLK